MKNKKIIFISIIIILIISIITITIYKINNKIITTEGEILVTGDNYLLIGATTGEDYVINTNKTNYNDGDKIKIDLTDINKDNTPYTAKAKKITIIKKNKEKTLSDNINTDNKINDSVSTNKETNNEQSTEVNIIKYFENLDTELSNYNQTDESLSKKIKTNFVKCIDFIFYGKEINNKTFSELTNTEKLKILEITLSIDSKIDTYFPEYKEDINNTYENIKLKTIEKYLEITTNICNNDEDLCQTAKENFQTLKTNFSITWDLVKDLASIGFKKLKNWYEIWRNN